MAMGTTRQATAGLSRPFGSPEGDRTQLVDPLHEFIDFSGPRFRSGLGMSPRDRSVRVIVGRKGAGKTLYLRRLQAAASKERSLYADDWQTYIFRDHCALRMLEWYRDERTAVERWEEVWDRAVMRSVVSHILTAPKLDAPLQDDVRAAAADLCPEYTGPETIYAQVADIVGTRKHRTELDDYLGARGWENLRRLVGTSLAGAKPVCFYLDALDEKFEHAPRQWLICQLGLFNAVMKLQRDARVGPRLHIVIGVRDIVFSSTQMSEHATKYLGSDSIRTLGWDWHAIEYFLGHKLQDLTPAHLMDTEADEPTVRWLGMTSIRNEARQRDEDPTRYILRHTRLIPRDVVVLGNMLCELIDHAKHEDQPFLSTDEVRETVHKAARAFGDEELFIVANHLIAESMPEGAVEGGYSDFYTDDTPVTSAYPGTIADRLREKLGVLREDRFTKPRLEDFAEEAADLIETRADALDVLWQHGLLGYVEGPRKAGRVVFYSASREDRLTLPRDRAAYGVHPIMIDTVEGIRGIGEVVQPY
jgi:hypothetical protein